MRFNKKFWATTFTLTGTIVGAGILGLPYVFAKSGFLIGLFWLITIGAVITFANLTLGEITLRTRGKHQLAGYAEKYLGLWGKRLMLAAVLFGVYSALLAYLIGEGKSLAQLIPGNTPPVIFTIFFWIIMTLLLKRGLKGLKRIETWGVIAVITIILGIFIKFMPTINPQNLISIHPEHFITPIGVIMFALLGFTSIPELRKEIKGQEHLLKKAILIGSTIPLVLYIIFSATFVGVLGKSITEVESLLVEILKNGELVAELPPIESLRQRRDTDVERMDPGVRRLMNPHIYHVSRSEQLWEKKQELIASALSPIRT